MLSVQHLRSALRPLLARPGFSAVVILTLGLGIGLDTAVYTVVDAALIRTLPFRDPDRLVRLDQLQLDEGTQRFGFSWPGLLELRQRTDLFEAVGAVNEGTASVRFADHAELVPVARVTANLLDILGMRPALGRGFQPGEEGLGAPALAILGHSFWKERFGADPGVLGRTVTIEGTSFTVVGVLPEAFRWAGGEGTAGERAPQVLLTLRPNADFVQRRNQIWLRVLARLGEGVPLPTARAGADALAARLRTDFPVDQLHVGMQVRPLRDAQVGAVRPVLFVLWGAVTMLLLLTCANVANLLLARALSREHEMAVRSALGATRSDLVRKLLGESLLLGLAGSLLGWVVARAALPALTSAIPPAQRQALPFLQDLRIDSAALAYAVALAVVTGVVFGLAPALRLSRAELGQSLREGVASASPRRHRAMQVLVLIQVALAVILLDGAGVFARSLASVLSVDPGFQPRGLVVGTVALPQRPGSTAQGAAIMDRLLSTLSAVPSVSGVAVTRLLPGTTASGQMGVRAAGTADPSTNATARMVTEDYFTTLGVPLLRGRGFTPSDLPDTEKVAVVNQTFARLHFPGQDAVGQRFQLTYKPDGDVFTVVGLVGDERLGPIDEPAPEAFYLPWRQTAYTRSPMGLAVRSPRGAAIIPEVRRAVASVDGDIAVRDLQRMDSMLDDSPAVFGRRYPVWLLGLFAVCATVLAAVGLFGVLSTIVGERTHELGIRLALGARRGQVMFEVARRVFPAVVGGLVLGTAGAWVAGTALRGLLVGTRALDLAVLVPTLGAMLLTGIIATLIPARRAATVDPAVALRAE